MTTSGKTVLLDREGPVAIITLNRPEQRNSIDTQLCEDMRTALAAFETDDSLSVAVLAGKGSVFCAGMDLKAFVRGGGEEIIFGAGGFAGFVRADRGKPVIAAVHGAAVAGGFEIMLACDMAVAEEGTVFGLPEPKLGLIAGAGGVFKLAQRIPPARACELSLTGRTFDAQAAHELGLLNRIAAKGGARDAAMEMARAIADNAPLAIRNTLRLSQAAAISEADQMWPLSDELLRQVMASDDAAEGARAFAEKRRPMWSGR